MKVEYVNPFVGAAITTCETMLNLRAERGPLTLKKDNTPPAEVTAMIGLSGNVRGSIVLAFHMDVAQAIVQRFLGMQEELPIEDICDGVGELCNIVGGSAKVELNKFGLELSISIPNVVVGKEMHVAANRAYPTLVVPFATELGSFQVEVCLMD